MYAKVFAQMYDGTLCTRGPWEALVTFQQMLVLADLEGSVDMTAEAISRRTTIPLQIIKKGLEELQKPDPESRTPTEDGRRIVPLCEGRSWGWKIVNYVFYRSLKREEDRREYHRNYWNEKRSPKAKTTRLKKLNKAQPPQPNQPIAEAEANTKAEEKKRKATASPRPVFQSSLIELPIWLPRELWTEWCEDRKERRKPITERAAQMQLAQLEAWHTDGLDAAQAIRASIANNWTGLFEPKPTGQKAATDDDPAEAHFRRGEYWASKPAS